jgi:anti-sigma B factor antagonist
MEIQEKNQDGVLVLHLSDQIDSTTGPVLGNRLEEVIGEGNTHLVLDLTHVPYISSAGLRVLSIALKAVRAPDVDGDLCLANLSNTVAHAFRISGFNQVFSIYNTVPEAVAALATSRQLDQDA